jgi:hypothetical protein
VETLKSANDETQKAKFTILQQEDRAMNKDHGDIRSLSRADHVKEKIENEEIPNAEIG